MRSLKAGLLLSALAFFSMGCPLFGVETFLGEASSEEVVVVVTPDAPVQFLALHSANDKGSSRRFVHLAAAYGSLAEPGPIPEDTAQQAPIDSENAVSVSVQNEQGESIQRGVIEETLPAFVDVQNITLCDGQQCAGYSIVRLEHLRGIDAELTLRIDGSWEFLRDDHDSPSTELVFCEEDCQVLADQYLSDQLAPCAFETLGCNPFASESE